MAEFMALVDVTPDDLVVEVGAGTGALSVAVAARCRELIAYELDESLAEDLTKRTGASHNIRVVMGDFLTSTLPNEPFKVVGNIPFSVTTPIVNRCLGVRTLRSATLITQIEYARKRTGSYGRWSLVTVQTWPEFSWELYGRIARTKFRPVPGVDAGVLHIERRGEPLVPRHKAAAYRRAVELGFSGVGGSLYASLSRRYASRRVADAFRRTGVDRETVVGQVSPDAWLRIFDLLEGGHGSGRAGS